MFLLDKSIVFPTFNKVSNIIQPYKDDTGILRKTSRDFREGNYFSLYHQCVLICNKVCKSLPILR